MDNIIASKLFRPGRYASRAVPRDSRERFVLFVSLLKFSIFSRVSGIQGRKRVEKMT